MIASSEVFDDGSERGSDFFGLLALSKIGRHADGKPTSLRVVAQGCGTELPYSALACRRGYRVFALVSGLRLIELGDEAPVFFLVLAVSFFGPGRNARNIILAVARNLGPLPVDREDCAVFGVNHDGEWRVVHCPAQPLLALPQRRLRPPFLGHIVEHHHHADRSALGILDGSGAVFNGPFGAVAGDQRGVIGQANGLPFSEHLFHRVWRRAAGLLVDDVEDLLNRPVQRLRHLPTGQLLGYRIERGDLACRIGRDHRVADAVRVTRSHSRCWRSFRSAWCL